VAEPALTSTAAAWEPGRDELVDAIGRLPEHERIVVVFHYLDGYSATEVAAMTGRPVGTVTKQISRGLDRLRQWLAEVPK